VQVAEQLLPLTGPLLQLLLTLHLRDQIRQQAARRAVAPDGDAGTRPVAVCSLISSATRASGQRLEADEIARSRTAWRSSRRRSPSHRFASSRRSATP